MRKKYRVSEIARITGESEANIHRWLSGEREIKLKKAVEISRKLGVPHTIFVDRDVQEAYLFKVLLKRTEK